MEKEKEEEQAHLLTLIISKIYKETNLPTHLKEQFMTFCLSYPMSEKHTNIFLNVIKGQSATIGYLYKHMVRTAIKYNVPKVYIKDYMKTKELVNNKYSISNRETNIRRMEIKSFLLMKSINDMDKLMNSRKVKINKLKDEIELKQLNRKAE